ncbi:hypothetical protein FJ651_15335, partial [Paucihalobacter ruber]
MKKNYPFLMKWDNGLLTKKAFITLRLILLSLLSFQVAQGQSSNDPNCIVFNSCPDDQILCANTTVNGELGAYVNWTLPDVSQNCAGNLNGNSFEMLFELNEQLLTRDCWNFNYISRVGTDGGSVKLFTSNDADGDQKSKIITPFLTLEDDTNVSIEINYVNGNYGVELFLVPPDNGAEISLGSIPVTANQTIYNWAADFDPGVGSVTGISGIYRLKFVFTYTGQRPSNANTGDTVIAVKGFLNETDDCSAGVDFTVSGPNQGFYAVGSYDLEYVAVYTAPNGEVYTESCQFNITVVDVELNLTSNDPDCTNPGSILAVAGIDGESFSGVAPFSYTLNPGNITNTSGLFENLSGGDYTITVTDANGCTKTSDIISLVTISGDAPTITAPDDVIIEGCEAADIITQNATVLPFNTIETTITEAQFLAEGGEFTSDNNVTFTYIDVQTGTCPITITRTFTITDECDATATAEQIFTIQDTTAPVAPAAPADFSVECIDDVPAPGDLTAADNCAGDITVTGVDSADNSDPCQIIITRTWTFTDDCDNTSSVSQTITVADTTAPVAPAAPADFSVECIDDVPAPGDLTATDNCAGDITVTGVDSADNSDPCQIIITRTWTFTDDCDNTSSVSQTITVADTTAPVATAAPADFSVECIDDVPAPGDLTAADNCAGDITVTGVDSADNSDPCQIIITRTWTFTDDCDNTSSVSQIITVADTTAPVAPAAPADFSVECIDDVPAPGDLTAADNCAGDITVTGVDSADNSDPCQIIITRTWTFTDDCDNTSSVSQTITVADTTAPEFEGNLPADILVECDAVPTASILTATDNCSDNVNVAFSEVRTDGDCPSNYTLTRTWTATDDCDNTTTYTQIVTVQDTTAPTITTVAADQTVSCDGSGNTDELQAWLNTNAGANAIDNCGSITWSNNFTSLTNDCGETGRALVTFTATDECGNSRSTTALFTIIDLLPPTINNPAADLTVQCDDDNELQLQSWLNANGGASASDNCSDIIWTNNFIELSDECGFTGSATVTFTASDECGNRTTTTATFTIEDNTAPTFVEALPADATVECDAVPTADTLTATDNCGDATVTFDETITEGACAGESVIVRTWTATDECGNETSHSQTITVQDTTAPAFVEALPADATVECDAVPTAETLTATDNCGDATVTFEEVTNEGECAGEFTVVRTWTATDECGNETSHSQTITVQDNTAPTFVEALPADATVECDAVPTADTLTATDNCGDATVTLNEYITEGACAGEFTVVRTWTATDECGNETSHSQTITVQDTTAPAFVEALPADATVECDAVPTADTLTATDNCGDATVTF